MSNFAFKPAVRTQVPLLIGLVGPSGGGKTLSALRLAKGIQSVAGGSIAGLDTEARRMLHYADRFEFLHLDFGPPHGPDRYLDAVRAAVETGAKTIIADSMSHEHEGEGGVLSWHEAELDRMAGTDFRKREACNMIAWAKPKGARRKLINGLLQLNVNLIFCFRAKEKMKIVKDPKDGKNKPVDIGWQAIAGEEFVYEMTDRFLLPPGARGVPDFSREAWETGVPKLPDEHEPIVRKDRQLDESIGAELARWAAGGKAPEVAVDPAATARRARMVADFEIVCREEGQAAFVARFKVLSKEDQALIGKAERDRIALLNPPKATEPATTEEPA
jgi:hypothetical protein